MGSFGLSKEQRNMVVVLLLGAVLVVLNQTLLSPALPSIMSHLSVNETTVQWLTSAYALTEAVVIPTAAWFMGRFSTRRLFMGCMTLFAAGSLVAAIAPHFAVLLLGRVMQALSTGVLMVMVMALILLVFPRESRGQAMGLVSLVMGFAPAVGPSVGGLLVDLVGWRALFCVVVVAAVAVILFAHHALRNREGFPRTSLDVPSVALSAVGLASLLYGLSSFTSSSNVGVCAALMVVGLVLVALFARRQFRLEEPMLRLEVLKSRRYRTGALTIALLEALLIGLGVLMPLYIQNVLGLSATASGLVTLPGAVLGAACGLVAGSVFDRSGVRGIALAGGVVLLAGSAGMFCYGVDSGVLFAVAAYALASLGMQMLMTPLNTWGVNSLRNELVQHATAVSNTLNQVGGSLGTALIMSFSAVGMAQFAGGSEVERVFAGYHLSFGVVLALSVAILLLIVFFVRNKAGDAKPQNTMQASAEKTGERGHAAMAASAGGNALQAERPAAFASAPQTAGDAAGAHSIVDVMDRHPTAIPADAVLSDAVRTLAAAGESGAVLVGPAGEVQGYLSNSDVLRFFGDKMQTVTGASGFVALRQLDDETVQQRVGRLSGMRALDVATRKVVSVGLDVPFETACALLAEKRLKQLPVVQDGKLVGVLHRTDLMRLLARLLDEGRQREDASASEGR